MIWAFPISQLAFGAPWKCFGCERTHSATTVRTHSENRICQTTLRFTDYEHLPGKLRSPDILIARQHAVEPWHELVHRLAIYSYAAHMLAVRHVPFRSKAIKMGTSVKVIEQRYSCLAAR